MIKDSYFTYQISDVEKTGIPYVGITDDRTGYEVGTILHNGEMSAATAIAYVMAQFSRANRPPAQSLELLHNGRDPNEGMRKIVNYGHNSVKDLDHIALILRGIPQLTALRFHNHVKKGDGQENSTRFMDFSEMPTIDLSHYVQDSTVVSAKEMERLNKEFRALQDLSVEYYSKYVQLLPQVFRDHFQIGSEDKKVNSAVAARVFDCARAFLLNGVNCRTGVGYVDSVRSYERVISEFGANKDPHTRMLAEQMLALLKPRIDIANELGYKPEAPELFKHTDPFLLLQQKLEQLDTFLNSRFNFADIVRRNKEFSYHPIGVEMLDLNITPGAKVLTQFILSLYPDADTTWLLNWVTNLSAEEQKEVGHIIHDGFNRHTPLGEHFKAMPYTFVMTLAMSAIRDLNRHRPWGRHLPWLDSNANPYNILHDGYTLPLYLDGNPALKNVRDGFEKDLQNYYKKLHKFAHKSQQCDWFPHHLMLQLIPFAHAPKFIMHATPEGIVYMTDTRVQPGGHDDYRLVAYLMTQLVADGEPFMEAFRISENEKPNPCDKAQFLSRG